MPLAVQLLDGAEVERGLVMSVAPAVFENTPKEESAPQDGGKKKKKTASQLRENKRQQERLLSWHEEKTETAKKKKAQAVLVLKHVFTPAAIDEDSTVLNDIKEY